MHLQTFKHNISKALNFEQSVVPRLLWSVEFVVLWSNDLSLWFYKWSEILTMYKKTKVWNNCNSLAFSYQIHACWTPSQNKQTHRYRLPNPNISNRRLPKTQTPHRNKSRSLISASKASNCTDLRIETFQIKYFILLWHQNRVGNKKHTHTHNTNKNQGDTCRRNTSLYQRRCDITLDHQSAL